MNLHLGVARKIHLSSYQLVALGVIVHSGDVSASSCNSGRPKTSASLRLWTGVISWALRENPLTPNTV